MNKQMLEKLHDLVAELRLERGKSGNLSGQLQALDNLVMLLAELYMTELEQVDE